MKSLAVVAASRGILETAAQKNHHKTPRFAHVGNSAVTIHERHLSLQHATDSHRDAIASEMYIHKRV